jgi:hypothetical protein
MAFDHRRLRCTGGAIPGAIGGLVRRAPASGTAVIRPNDEHRAWQLGEHSFGRVANDAPGDARAAHGSYHEQVDVMVAREVRDNDPRVALREMHMSRFNMRTEGSERTLQLLTHLLADTDQEVAGLGLAPG